MATHCFKTVRQEHGLPIGRLFYELNLVNFCPPNIVNVQKDVLPIKSYSNIESFMNESLETNLEPIESKAMLSSCTQVPPGKVAKLKRFRHSRNRPYFYKPYDFPWRSKLEESIQAVNNSLENKETESAPPTVSVSRQDSGNKSNPGSPVKNQESSSKKTGCSIIRSRSLDDLDIAKFSLCDRHSGRVDIDLVSQRINDLHVS